MSYVGVDLNAVTADEPDEELSDAERAVLENEAACRGQKVEFADSKPARKSKAKAEPEPEPEPEAADTPGE